MGSSMKDIKLRIKSVESTMQITKAMELVASSKLRRAKERAERARPFFNTLHSALADIAYGNTDFSSPYVQQRKVKKTCYVIIAGDRGLAGGYNSNLFKAAVAHAGGKAVCMLPVGKKAVEYAQRHRIETLTSAYAVVEDIGMTSCAAMAKLLCEEFRKGTFDTLYVCYTNFVSMLSQQPAVLKVLPIRYDREQAKSSVAQTLILYEPSCEAVYNAIVPDYVTGLLYGAISESVASELGARRTAMDAASKNANDMIDSLSLRYNRARQGAITQEITEIVAGAEA